MRRFATDDEKALAAKLRSEGLSYREIGRRLGRSKELVRYWLDANRREQIKAALKARRLRQYVLAPRKPKYTQQERKKRAYLRMQARQEAAQTGEPVGIIYERWGVN